MLESKDFNHLVAARLRDFFEPGERWFRGLWDVGLVLSLTEILEATEAAAQGVLSPAAVQWLCDDVRSLLLTDTGVTGKSREAFERCLKTPAPKFRDAHWYSLRDLTAEIQDAYLLSWAEAAEASEAGKANANKPLKPERMARAIAGHLLDVGFSQRFLSGWLKQQFSAPKIWSLPELIREFHRLAKLGPITFSVLVPVTAGLDQRDKPEEWVNAGKVKTLLAKAKIRHERLRYAGGWLVRVEQRDPYSAAQAAFDEVEKRAARLLVGRGQRMSAVGPAYVFGEPTPVTVHRTQTSHRVRVGSIERQQQLFVQATTKVDAAFELLAQLDSSSAVAVAAGWAAVEALLAQSEEKVVAAHRLATLVAASFPRAELTSLAADQMRRRTPVGAQLEQLLSNRERAGFLADEILAKREPAFETWSDRAALARIKRLLERPRDQMEDVLNHVHRAFRRYYRQRNLVLHWGNTNPVALRACLRTGTPLLTAGIDRIAHAWFVHGIDPVALAIRAKSRLDLADRPTRKLTEFLEGLGG